MAWQIGRIGLGTQHLRTSEMRFTSAPRPEHQLDGFALRPVLADFGKRLEEFSPLILSLWIAFRTALVESDLSPVAAVQQVVG